MPIIENSADQINKTFPTDPHTAAEFDAALCGVHSKYRAGTPISRRELLRLAQAALGLIEREGK